MSISVRVSSLRWLVAMTVVALMAVVLVAASVYTLDETEQAVVIQFGRPVGEAVTAPGLHFKKPFVQEVRRFDKRILAWDGAPDEITTRAREFITVDATARWRIVNPLTFLQSVKDESGAQSRLDDIIDSAVRDNVSSLDLVEIVRSQNWEVDAEQIAAAGISEKRREILSREIEVGRDQLQRNILTQARQIVPQYGIELVDVRITRLNYVPAVQEQVFNRMTSERERIAEQFRAEGSGRAAEIAGQTKKKLAAIRSEAQREAEITRGEADAEATRIYNEAYGLDPEFFAFYRTMASYRKSIGAGTTIFLSADSAYFRYLRDAGTGGAD